jgi:hypothetical protein
MLEPEQSLATLHATHAPAALQTLPPESLQLMPCATGVPPQDCEEHAGVRHLVVVVHTVLHVPQLVARSRLLQTPEQQAEPAAQGWFGLFPSSASVEQIPELLHTLHGPLQHTPSTQ